MHPAAGRGAFWAAWSLWALTIGASAIAMGYVAGRPLPAGSGQGSAANNVIGVAFILTFATVGALLAWKRSSNPIGWLLSATAICYTAGGFGLFLQHFRATLTAAQWSGWIWLVGPALTVFVLLLFPTGSLPSRRWRIVAWTAAAGIACWITGNAFAPMILTSGPPEVPNPIGLSGPAGRAVGLLAGLGAGVVVLSRWPAVGSLAVRYRRSGFVQREQLKWLLYAAALIVIGLLANLVVGLPGQRPASREQPGQRDDQLRRRRRARRDRDRGLQVPAVRHRHRHQQDAGLRLPRVLHHRRLRRDRGRHRVLRAASGQPESAAVDRRDRGRRRRVPPGQGARAAACQLAGVRQAGDALRGADGAVRADDRHHRRP